MAIAPEESLRDQIVNAALTLFLAKGYQTTTVQDIIDVANCSKGGFYHHFASKEDLLYLIHDTFITYELQQGEAVMKGPGTASDKLRQMMIDLVHSIELYRPHVTVFFEERRFLSSERFALVKEKRDRYEQLFRAVVEEGIRTGEFPTDLNPRIIVFAIFGMCNWTYQWLQSNKGFSVRAIGQMFCDLLFQGLLSSQSLAMFLDGPAH
jgi:TetR/AcrR family transcriptional regulator, cholesterol catabolism regulator